MRHRNWALLLPLFPALLSTGSAPNIGHAAPLMHSHSMMHRSMAHGASPNIINGAEHPELIPDSVAYRLYFITVANMPPELQQAELRQEGLSSLDIGKATAALANFKAQWDTLRGGYNQSVEKLGGAADTATFAAQRDALVASSRSAMRATLSDGGNQALEEHLQAAKRHIKLGVPAAGNGGSR